MSSKADSLKVAGNDAFRLGKHEEAIALYSEAFTLDPSQYTYPLNRCMCYLKLGKNREAERDASKSLQLLPAGNPKAFYRRGLARKALGKLELARADFEAALKEDPSNAAVKTELDSLPAAAQPASSSTTGTQGKTAESKQPEAHAGDGPVSSDKATGKPTSSHNGLDSQTRKTLKAAITPESSADDSNVMISAVSTRRLTKPTAVDHSNATPSAKHRHESDSSNTVKDFKALRIARDQRLQTTPARTGAPTSSPTTSTAHAAAQTSQDSKPAPSSVHDRVVHKVQPPKTMYELEKRWQDHRDTASRTAILLSLVDHKVDIPALVGSSLSPELLDEMLVCLKQAHEQDANVAGPAISLLHSFSQCQRFTFVSMLCGNIDFIGDIVADAPGASEVKAAWGLAQ